VPTDITNYESVRQMSELAITKFGKIDILINNAANNPHYESIKDAHESSRFELFPLEIWNLDITVGLTGAFLCSQIIGTHMANNGSGVIVNIASDLALIAPDQRIYRQEGIPDDSQPTKPITYSVVKSGLLGLTRYIATYWADKGIRCNALVPGGVYNNQDPEFIVKLTNLIPLQRMAELDEYKASIVFLCSNASSYMTGASLVMDGGRTAW
jgi:NAD(P)-dependent dehydrogenase (short-subunit alcohol dehydrogenase family)